MEHDGGRAYQNDADGDGVCAAPGDLVCGVCNHSDEVGKDGERDGGESASGSV